MRYMGVLDSSFNLTTFVVISPIEGQGIIIVSPIC